jgi:hypothetical protein
MTRTSLVIILLGVLRCGMTDSHAQPSPADDPDATVPRPPSPLPEPPPVPTDTPPVPADVPVEPPIQTTTPPPPVAPEPLPPPPPTPPAQESPSTSAMWEPSYHFDLHWRLLMLPERVIGLAAIPFELLVGAIERHALDKRFGDLVTFYNGRIKIAPRFKFSFGDGAGAGLWIKRTRLFDERAEARLGGVYRVDGDYQLELEYEHALLFPGGRGLRLRSYIEDDKNQRFYGLGNESLFTDRRVVRSKDLGLFAEMDLQGVDRYTYSGVVQLGLRRQELSAGVSSTYPPVMEGDTVLPPPGFDDTALFADMRLVGRFDTRDTYGRPTRGIYAEASALGRTDVTGKSLSAVTLNASARLHLPIAPDRRVLLLSIGGAAALHMLPGTEIPLDSYAYLGRTNLLRGYDRERFRDLYAMQASVEYRFPIYEYLASRAGLDAFGFFDAGTTWGVNAFSLSPLRYSYGGGLRAAHETTLVFELTVGFSPEGNELNLGVEKAL